MAFKLEAKPRGSRVTAQTVCCGRNRHGGTGQGRAELAQTLKQHWNSSWASLNTSTSRKSRSRWSTERRPQRSGAGGEQWAVSLPGPPLHPSPNTSVRLDSLGLRLQLWRSWEAGAWDGALPAPLLGSVWPGGSWTVLGDCEGARDCSSRLRSPLGVPGDTARRTT